MREEIIFKRKKNKRNEEKVKRKEGREYTGNKFFKRSKEKDKRNEERRSARE